MQADNTSLIGGDTKAQKVGRLRKLLFNKKPPPRRNGMFKGGRLGMDMPAMSVCPTSNP
ncbi:MAG: hypothetical protein Q4G22_10885 [Paracoccus sp. (in: a-proteobacteria)]|nr:hypothetical protein [Paracoccus sp. (in: a-proteobacteria)]